MKHRGTETQRLNEITGEIIGAAIEVHRELGPGLLESVYEECLCHELHSRKLKFRRQLELPIKYKEVNLDYTFRLDLIVEKLVVVELKTVEKVIPVHLAQIHTYIKLINAPLGLLINFNVPVLKAGINRVVNKGFIL